VAAFVTFVRNEVDRRGKVIRNAGGRLQ